jgi:hypothetical protein
MKFTGGAPGLLTRPCLLIQKLPAIMGNIAKNLFRVGQRGAGYRYSETHVTIPTQWRDRGGDALHSH